MLRSFGQEGGKVPDPTNPVLYKVRRPNGSYFAIYDPQTGRLWTERSEPAARAQAQELGLSPGVAKSVDLPKGIAKNPFADSPKNRRRK
jgi:hypothetical protein